MKKKPILITTAMSSEMELLLKKIENNILKKELDYEIHEGEIDGYPVVLLKTKVGTINSAISLSFAIQKYNPTIIINQGTAGSHEKTYKKFDLVIGDSVININSIKTGIKYEGMGTEPLKWEIKEFRTDSEDTTNIYKTDEKMMNIAKQIIKKYEFGNVHIGRIGSGDVWNREVERIKWFNSNYQTVCEDMEAISNYRVAQIFNVPIIAFKVISNNELIGEKFDVKTTEGNQSFTYNFVKEYIKNIK